MSLVDPVAARSGASMLVTTRVKFPQNDNWRRKPCRPLRGDRTARRGGMGKVWRAHHTALKRDDALKVLPDAFASDADRLARFRREAQVLASLNHPNIAHVHGLEQSDGVQALVMELVEGPTLADRIAQGPIPVDEALPIAKQIAEVEGAEAVPLRLEEPIGI